MYFTVHLSKFGIYNIYLLTKRNVLAEFIGRQFPTTTFGVWHPLLLNEVATLENKYSGWTEWQLKANMSFFELEFKLINSDFD